MPFFFFRWMTPHVAVISQRVEGERRGHSQGDGWAEGNKMQYISLSARPSSVIFNSTTTP